MSGDDTATAFCTECGSEMTADTKFCPECGAEQAVGSVADAESPTEPDGDKSAFHRLPGFGPGNSTRRNVLVGAGYSLAGLVAIGAAAGPQEGSGNGGGGNGGSTGGGNGGSTGGGNGGSSDGEEYPNAFYYDDSTGIVIEDDVSAEVDSIGSMYIRGTARNESGGEYSYVQLEWTVLDSSGAKIADGLANTSGLDAGQSWRFEALAPSAENADTYRLENITAY